MACCLPLGIAAAAGAAGLGVALAPVRPYLMAISGALLLLSLWQLYRRPRTCRPRSTTTLVIFWTCAAIVLIMMVMPQLLAGFLADL
jgi:hypothetical protein